MNLKNIQYDLVMRHYDDVREKHRLENEARLAEVSRTVPLYGVLTKELAGLYALTARNRILGKNDNETAMAIAEKKACRSRLLEEAGYPADYTEMTYDCPLCHDTGYVGQTRCSCFNKTACDLLYRRFAPSDISEEDTLEHFKTDLYSDKIGQEDKGRSPRELAAEAKAFAGELVKQQGKDRNMLLYGPTGIGKTFLSRCILNEALTDGRSALYFSAGDLFDLLADAAFDRRPDAAAEAELMAGSELLIIDDLGTEMKNELVETELFRLINERISRPVSTVISTNLAPRNLSTRYSERIFSRLAGSFRLARLSGADLRLKLKLQEK